MVKYLLNNGIDVNIINKSNIDSYIDTKFVKSLYLLIDYGLDIDLIKSSPRFYRLLDSNDVLFLTYIFSNEEMKSIVDKKIKSGKLNLNQLINLYLNDLVYNDDIYRSETLEDYLTSRLQIPKLSERELVKYLSYTVDNIALDDNIIETLNKIYNIDYITMKDMGIDSVFTPLTDILTNDEIKILTKYATIFYQELNTTLRSGTFIKEIKEYYNEIMNIFHKVPPLHVDVRVFRAVRPFLDITYENIEPGFRFKENSFTSTTVKCCSDYFMSKSDDTFLLSFIIPSGFPVIPMKGVNNDVEMEILMPPGTTWEVIDKDQIRSNRAVYLKLIDYDEYIY